MHQLNFRVIDPQTIADQQPAIAEAILPATVDLHQVLVEVAELPFYEGYSLYAITDLRLPTGEVYELLCGPNGAFLLDGGNEAIYRVNELAPLRLTPETLLPYLRFFFSCTTSAAGPFILAESAEDLPWLPEADQKIIVEATAKLQPLTLLEHHADDLCLLNATILFRDGLYSTDILVAPCPLTREGNEEEDSMLAGEIRLVNHELLMEELEVETDMCLEKTAEDEEVDDEELDDDPSVFAFYKPFSPTAGFDFHEKSAEFAAQVVAAMPEEIRPRAISEDGFHLAVADLTFYPDFCLCALTDPAMPLPNVRFFLSRREIAGQLVPMNKTNGPIYDFNSKGPLLLTPESMPSYVRFFFFLVQGQLGRFNTVERPEDVAWQPTATEKDKQTVNGLLMPVSYIGIDEQGLHTLKATVIFHDSLFRTEVKIAPQSMEVLDPETNEKEQLFLGQMQLVNEEVLLEELPVMVAN
ncbi:hypothetical protein [Desulfobulbus sp.]|uniref:hypothetical protein n=1 Tax=Desulfobulbus sp. TaxID=895 RepID=UPI00286ECAB1|nr:hypothetical protein [Desulfobulbus sp.]